MGCHPVNGALLESLLRIIFYTLEMETEVTELTGVISGDCGRKICTLSFRNLTFILQNHSFNRCVQCVFKFKYKIRRIKVVSLGCRKQTIFVIMDKSMPLMKFNCSWATHKFQ